MADSKPSASATKARAFKPRAGVVRKNKAEREAYAKEEAEKAAARAAVAAQAAGKPSQSTKPSTSKKREATRDNRDGTQAIGSGVFGAGSGTRSGWKRSTQDGGRSEMLEGQEGVRPSEAPSLQGQDGGVEGQKGGGGSTFAGGRGARPVLRDGVNFDSDDELDEAKRDIERIWISSDEEEDNDGIANTGKGKARAQSELMKPKRGGGLRPVRAPRTVPIMVREAESERRGEKRTIKSGRTVIEDGDVHEEGDEMEVDDDMITDGRQIKRDMPSSPELSRRTKLSRKLGTRAKDGKIATETVEERAERLRLNEDIEKLRDEFVVFPTIKKDEDADQTQGVTKQEGKLLLFQFPPLVPFLVDQASTDTIGADDKQKSRESGPSIKADPDGPAQENSSSKDDASNTNTSLPKVPVEGMLTAREPARLPSGCVGKLRVHRSGKVTLDWGGIDMEVRYGTEVNFLQDAVLVETPAEADENENKDTGNKVGTTYALGPVQKKMIVIPDWQKLYD